MLYLCSLETPACCPTARFISLHAQLIISLGEICLKLKSVFICVDMITKHVKFSDVIEQITQRLHVAASALRFVCVLHILVRSNNLTCIHSPMPQFVFHPSQVFPSGKLEKLPRMHVESCIPRKVSWMFGFAIDDETRTNLYFYKDAGMCCLLLSSASLHKQNAQAVCTTDRVNKPPEAGVPPLRSPYGRWQPADTPSEVFSRSAQRLRPDTKGESDGSSQRAERKAGPRLRGSTSFRRIRQ